MPPESQPGTVAGGHSPVDSGLEATPLVGWLGFLLSFSLSAFLSTLHRGLRNICVESDNGEARHQIILFVLGVGE